MKLVIISSIVIGTLLGVQLSQVQHNHDGQGGFNYSNPESKFNTSNNSVNHSVVTWRAVDNVQATCNSESLKRGNGGFGYTLEACSFWNGNQCTIITAKKTTIHALGHETLHCFQGSFH